MCVSGDSAGRYVLTLKDPREPTPFRQYTAGGMNHMFISGEPLLIVRGTTGRNKELVQAIREFSEDLSRRATPWWPFRMGRFILGQIPVKADVDVTGQDIKDRNLILVGPASANEVLRRITKKLPGVEEDNVLAIGKDRHDLRGKAYGLFHYNPEAPKRLIMVLSSSELEFYKKVM